MEKLKGDRPWCRKKILFYGELVKESARVVTVEDVRFEDSG